MFYKSSVVELTTLPNGESKMLAFQYVPRDSETRTNCDINSHIDYIVHNVDTLKSINYTTEEFETFLAQCLKFNIPIQPMRPCDRCTRIDNIYYHLAKPMEYLASKYGRKIGNIK